MTNQEAIRILIRLQNRINWEVTDAQKKMDALNMAIKALERMAPPDCERVTNEEHTEDEEVITLHKGALKAVTGRFVVYDRKWLKEHFNTTEAMIYGAETCEDCISRESVLGLLQNDTVEINVSSAGREEHIFAEINVDALKSLPSVTPAMIPVSERLPEPKKDVVVWTIQGNKPRYFVAALFPHKTYGYVWIGEEEIHLYPEQVLYWMSLPDLYDGEVGG